MEKKQQLKTSTVSKRKRTLHPGYLSDKVLRSIAERIGKEWTHILIDLGLSQQQCDQIEIDHRHLGVVTWTFQGLLIWRDTIVYDMGEKQLLETLLAALTDIRKDLADEIRDNYEGIHDGGTQWSDDQQVQNIDVRKRPKKTGQKPNIGGSENTLTDLDINIDGTQMDRKSKTSAYGSGSCKENRMDAKLKKRHLENNISKGQHDRTIRAKDSGLNQKGMSDDQTVRKSSHNDTDRDCGSCSSCSSTEDYEDTGCYEDNVEGAENRAVKRKKRKSHEESEIEHLRGEEGEMDMSRSINMSSCIDEMNSSSSTSTCSSPDVSRSKQRNGKQEKRNKSEMLTWTATARTDKSSKRKRKLPDHAYLTDQRLMNIAKKLGEEWEQVAIDLGLSIGNLYHIRMDNKHSAAVILIGKALLQWRNNSADKSEDELVKILQKALISNRRKDLADEVESDYEDSQVKKKKTSHSRSQGDKKMGKSRGEQEDTSASTNQQKHEVMKPPSSHTGTAAQNKHRKTPNTQNKLSKRPPSLESSSPKEEIPVPSTQKRHVPKFLEEVCLLKELEKFSERREHATGECTVYVNFQGQILNKTKAIESKSKTGTQFCWLYVQDDSGVLKVFLFKEKARKYASELEPGKMYRFINFYVRRIEDDYMNYDVIQNLNAVAKASSHPPFDSHITEIPNEHHPVKSLPQRQMLSLSQVLNSPLYTNVWLSEGLVIKCEENDQNAVPGGRESISLTVADHEDQFLKVCVLMYPERDFHPDNIVGKPIIIRNGRVCHSSLGDVCVEVYSEISIPQVSSYAKESKFGIWMKSASVKKLLEKYETLLKGDELFSLKCLKDRKFRGKIVKLKATIAGFGTKDSHSIREGCPDKKCDGKLQKVGRYFRCKCNKFKNLKSSDLVQKYNVEMQLQEGESKVFLKVKSSAMVFLLGPASTVEEYKKKIVWLKGDSSHTFHIDCDKGLIVYVESEDL